MPLYIKHWVENRQKWAAEEIPELLLRTPLKQEIFNSPTVIFYNQALPHSNKFHHFNLLWVTLTHFAICTSLNWLNSWKTKCVFQVKYLSPSMLDDWGNLSVFIWVWHMCSGETVTTEEEEAQGRHTGNRNHHNWESTLRIKQPKHWQRSHFPLRCISFAWLDTKNTENQDWWIRHCGKLLAWLHKLLFPCCLIKKSIKKLGIWGLCDPAK